jgi:SAM-dependent methyltransferase
MSKGAGSLVGACLVGCALASSAPAVDRTPPPAARAAASAGLTRGLIASTAFAQQTFDPTPGMAGKDVVWVPTPPEVVEKMLDLARVTPQDFVVDLGSGDGRNVIAAAKRGARALGVEYNPDMVELSRRLAREAGVADKATFVQGDMYEAEFSKATVLALFLLPHNLERLKDKILALKPGTRMVLNTFTIDGWDPDETERVGGSCSSWCNVLLHIVPAKVAGTWRGAGGELLLEQTFQKVTGTMATGDTRTAVENGRLRGDEITFTAGGTTYTGRVTGDRMTGTATRAGAGDVARRAWTVTRQAK